jgi:cobalamin synthase
MLNYQFNVLSFLTAIPMKETSDETAITATYNATPLNVLPIASGNRFISIIDDFEGCRQLSMIVDSSII